MTAWGWTSSLMLWPLAAAVGVLIWWIIRLRQKRVWLPTVRVLPPKARDLPTFVWRMPPLIAFLCFLFAALAVATLAGRPVVVSSLERRLPEGASHVFVDMTPSIAANVSVESLADRAAEAWQSLAEAGTATMGTSHGGTVHRPASRDEVLDLIRTLGFQRPGARMAGLIRKQLEQTGPLQRMVILSDRDQDSWSSFQWRALAKGTDLRFWDVTSSSIGGNVYFQRVDRISPEGASIIEWEVELARTGAGTDEAAGSIQVVRREKTLAQMDWQMAAGVSHQTMTMSWPRASQDAERGDEGDENSMTWSLATEAPNSLAMDDVFRTHAERSEMQARIIAEPPGERFLEDPTYQLQLVLGHLGVRPQRQDRWSALDAARPVPWTIVAADPAAQEQEYCPVTKATFRQHIWLYGQNGDGPFDQLCRCLHRLVPGLRGATGAQTYCQGLQSRELWVGVLSSLGAKQIGGGIGDRLGSLAWSFVDPEKQVDVMVLTVPLMPSMATGINHGMFPGLLRDLVAVAGPQGGSVAGAWPRITDISEWVVDDTTIEPDTSKQQSIPRMIQMSNVPEGESLLRQVNINDMPPPMSSSAQEATSAGVRSEQITDPRPWILAGTIVVLLALLLEVLIRSRKTAATLVIVVGCGLLGLESHRAQAQVELTLLGTGIESVSLSRVARDVGLRTSIEFNPRSKVIASIDKQGSALREPWLWVRQLSAITDNSGRMRAEMRVWLKKGGFLVLEGTFPDDALTKLVQGQFAPMRAEAPPTFRNVPTDSELTRSFYLIDTLPTCQGAAWRTFEFDGRVGIVVVPIPLSRALADVATPLNCVKPFNPEQGLRSFINLLMVALATDYKKDQIHLPEILKRLR